MKRIVKEGDHVIFTDTHRKRHNALVTMVWDVEGVDHEMDSLPAINLVIVVGDDSANDQYGRQIERMPSTPHLAMNSAEANCWSLP